MHRFLLRTLLMGVALAVGMGLSGCSGAASESVPGQVVVSTGAGPLGATGRQEVTGRTVLDVTMAAATSSKVQGDAAPTGVQFEVRYDPSRLHYAGVPAGSMSPAVRHYQISGSTAGRGSLIVQVETATAVADDSTVLQLAFDRIGQGDTELALHNVRYTEATQ